MVSVFKVFLLKSFNFNASMSCYRDMHPTSIFRWHADIICMPPNMVGIKHNGIKGYKPHIYVMYYALCKYKNVEGN